MANNRHRSITFNEEYKYLVNSIHINEHLGQMDISSTENSPQRQCWMSAQNPRFLAVVRRDHCQKK